MNEMIALVLVLLAGFGIGVVFYGGLWLTVSRIQTARHSWLLVAASSVMRTALALAAMWWIAQGSGARLALCLPGFVLARFAVLRLTRTLPRTQSPTAKEPSCT